MRKILAGILLCALLLTGSAGLTVHAQDTSDSGRSAIVGVVQKPLHQFRMNLSAVDPADLQGMWISSGQVIDIWLQEDQFEWDGAPPSSAVMQEDLRRAGIKLEYSFAAGRDLVSFGANNATMSFYNKVAGQQPFDFELYLTRNGVVQEGTRVRIQGNLLGEYTRLPAWDLDEDRDFLWVSPTSHYYVNENLQQVMISWNEIYTVTDLVEGEFMSGGISSTVREEDEPVLARYPQIAGVYHVEASPDLQRRKLYFYYYTGFHVYDGDTMEYLGVNDDGVPFAATYYLAASRLSAPVPEKYRLVYHDNGATEGGLKVLEAQYFSGQGVYISSPEGMRRGSEHFYAWNSSPDGSGDTYHIGYYLLPRQDLHLYAMYYPKDFIPYGRRLVSAQYESLEGLTLSPRSVIRFELSDRDFERYNLQTPITVQTIADNLITADIKVAQGEAAVERVVIESHGDQPCVAVYFAAPAAHTAFDVTVFLKLYDRIPFSFTEARITGVLTA